MSKVNANKMFASWKGILEVPSAHDERNTVPGPLLPDLVLPICPGEIDVILAKTKESSVGPDRLPLSAVRQIGLDTLVCHFNLGLLAEHLPKKLNASKTNFIPKKEDADALEHRPISICSHLTRLFHKVLAQRMEKLVPLYAAGGFP